MIVCVIDIDGTLADASHRIHHIEKEPPDWDAFGHPELVKQDVPQPGAKVVLDRFRKLGYHVCFLTGRNEKHRKATEEWVNSHMGRKDYRNEVIYMRPQEQANTPASVYKEKQINNLKYIYEEMQPQFLFFEDDPFVARMYQKYGTVFKAPECWSIILHAAPDHEVEPVKRY
jgi:hydroxymethylpyrimidine pyrophosphatase-like HAD family hydrolase